MNRSLQRIAHRGGSQLAPENTLAAFRNALMLPVDAIELDVQMTRDGRAIVFHDYTIERLTNSEGNILDLDFAYLRSLNAAARFASGWPQSEQIPTLDEVLTLVKGRRRVSIEIKYSRRDGVYGRYPHITQTVVESVRAAGMLDQVLIISFDWEILGDVCKLEPGLATGMNVANEWWQAQGVDPLGPLFKQADEHGCEWLNLDYHLVTPAGLDSMHQRGYKVGVWTVDTLDELRQFAAAGVDALTTDRPDLFVQMLPSES